MQLCKVKKPNFCEVEKLAYPSNSHEDTVILSAGAAGGPVGESWHLIIQVIVGHLSHGVLPLEDILIAGGLWAWQKDKDGRKGKGRRIPCRAIAVLHLTI